MSAIPIPDPAASAPPAVTPTPKVDIETCGLPGKPVCAVKVDEVGTPTGLSDFSVPGGVRDAAADSILGHITTPGAPTTLPWSLSAGVFGIPSGSCSPFVWTSRLGSITSDVCHNTLVLTLRSMLAWSMYALTLLYVWRRANESLERS